MSVRKETTMAGQNADTGQITWILGRPVEAINSDGGSAMIDLRCERIGPPGRPMHSPDTSFRVTLHDVPAADPAVGAIDAIDAVDGTVTIQREAPTLWDAFLDARTALDTHGWLLTIAGSRTDRWCIQAQRRPGVGTVHPFDNPRAIEGILTPAPPAALGTVAAQRRAYQEWIAAHGQTSETPA